MAPIRNWISPRRDGTSAFALQVSGVTGKAQRHKVGEKEIPRISRMSTDYPNPVHPCFYLRIFVFLAILARGRSSMLDARYSILDGGCWFLDMALLGNRGVKPLLQLEDTGRQPASADGGRGEGADGANEEFCVFPVTP